MMFRDGTTTIITFLLCVLALSLTVVAPQIVSAEERETLPEDVELTTVDDAVEIVYVDKLDGQNHYLVRNKRVRFKKHDGLSSPLCVSQDFSGLKTCGNLNDEPKSKESEGE